MPLCLVFFACNSSEEVDIKPETTALVNVKKNDSIQVDLTVKVKESKAAFSRFEDYATLDTKTKLIATFGEENLIDKVSYYAEGEVKKKTTVLTNPKTNNVIRFLWRDDQPDSLSFIEAFLYIYDAESYEVVDSQHLYTNCGLYTGMDINKLRNWNATDFSFSGFGWDYAGGVFEVEGSRLAACDVKIRLGLQADSKDQNHGLYGDVEFNTANPKVMSAPILVDQLTYHVYN